MDLAMSQFFANMMNGDIFGVIREFFIKLTQNDVKHAIVFLDGYPYATYEFNVIKNHKNSIIADLVHKFNLSSNIAYNLYKFMWNNRVKKYNDSQTQMEDFYKRYPRNIGSMFAPVYEEYI